MLELYQNSKEKQTTNESALLKVTTRLHSLLSYAEQEIGMEEAVFKKQLGNNEKWVRIRKQRKNHHTNHYS